MVVEHREAAVDVIGGGDCIVVAAVIAIVRRAAVELEAGHGVLVRNAGPEGGIVPPKMAAHACTGGQFSMRWEELGSATPAMIHACRHSVTA